MKRIAMIHTVRGVLDGFEKRVVAAMPGRELRIHNMLDEYLATDAAERGTFTKTNKRRFYNLLQAAAMTGADVIVVTCSTLTPVVAEMRALFEVPVIAIDDAMCRQAVRHGTNVAVLATAQSTIVPTTSKISGEAEAAGVEVKMSATVCDSAFAALKRGDMPSHDRDVVAAAKGIAANGADVIVLAQASMAHLDAEIAELTGVTTLSSAGMCVNELTALICGQDI